MRPERRAWAAMPEKAPRRLRIDLWSDVICPFCWIGRHRLDAALRNLGLEDETDVVLHAFELDPSAPPARPLLSYLSQRFGADAPALAQRTRRMAEAEGLSFAYERAIAAPTFDAHRLALLAQAQGRGAATMERLMRAHFTQGEDVSDRATLQRIGEESGLDAAEVARLLAGDAYAAEARADEDQARTLGVRGVPFFLVDGRYALSGAHPVETFERALREALPRPGPAP